jgi:ABC-2 type transport system ATP-binding protein
VGPNGGGRTTLLRVLAALVRPSSGVVEVAGLDAVRQVFKARSHVAYVGEAPLPGFGLCVREYLEFVCASRHIKGAAAVDGALARVALAADAEVDALSSGFRQRLALACALITDPDVLLLDNPLQAIDSRARSSVLEWLHETRERGTTMVIALSHEQDPQALCDRMLGLEAGRVVQVGGHMSRPNRLDIRIRALAASGKA